MVKVQISKLDPNVEIPTYKTEGSSGVDLMAFINKPIKLRPGTSCLVPTGLSIAIPKDCEVQIRPRSGLAAKSNITVLNTPGTIDSDYRGGLSVILLNLGSAPFIVKHGQRIAQLVIAKYSRVKINIVEDMSETDRNESGYGSTGNF